ncbi:hypothetical protein PGTUg99_008524 [Puccinia graminis f. sp. tritici]|uniref:Uncharacterized protein n=1 Tax=Puccinia graminis f. sp. tritici TaxID=56615 RepID=A0A5B0NAJ0_PUCGR|nr:hypothetical protein PGTUg99_008524 [Puccinia graminis f. sp. tritici]
MVTKDSALPAKVDHPRLWTLRMIDEGVPLQNRGTLPVPHSNAQSPHQSSPAPQTADTNAPAPQVSDANAAAPRVPDANAPAPQVPDNDELNSEWVQLDDDLDSEWVSIDLT